MSFGLDYLGQYRVSGRGKQVLKRLGTSTQAVVDWNALKWLEGVPGVELVPERDNKSVWTPEWIGIALAKFTEAKAIPPELTERITAIWQAESVASKSRAHVPGARVPGARGPKPTTSTGHIRGSALSTESKVSSQPKGTEGHAAPRSGGVGTSGTHGAHLTRVGADESRGRRALLAHRGPGGNRSLGRSKEHSEAYERAKAACLAAAGGRGRRRELLSLDEVARKYVHPSHFAGAPYFTRNVDALESALGHAERIHSGRRSMDPYVAGRRVQHGPSGPKGRLVWMASLATTLLSTRFSKPAYWGMVGREGFAYGRRNMEIGTYLSSLQSRHEFTYALDFSAFDASLPAWLIADCFDILATHLRMDSEEKSLYRRLVNDFIHSRLMLPDQSVWQVHRGVPSGSAFTSLIDSIANYLIIQYCWIRLTGHGIKPHDMMVLGDDSVVGSGVFIELGTLASVANELGVNLSADKSVRARSHQMVPFLGHDWSNSRAHRSRQDLAIRMAFPERHKYRSKADSMVRMYSYIPDADEALNLFHDAFPAAHTRDMHERVRQALLSVGVESLGVDQIRDGPGRLRYQSDVEHDASTRSLMTTGIQLAIKGSWAT